LKAGKILMANVLQLSKLFSVSNGDRDNFPIVKGIKIHILILNKNIYLYTMHIYITE